MRRQAKKEKKNHSHKLPCFPLTQVTVLYHSSLALRQTVMSSRLCWTLLALVYFWINPLLRRRSSIHPVLKSLKSTAFFCHHIRFLSRSLAGRNWLQLNKVSCIIHALIPPGFLEQVITILFHPVQACSYMDNMLISCSLWNPVFSVCVCMCACMRFQQFLTWISGYDRRLGTEHFYVILLFL